MFASNHFRLQQEEQQTWAQQHGTRRRRQQRAAMHHCQRASSLKANLSDAAAAAAAAVFFGGGSSFSDDNSDSGRGEMYRFQKRLDLQQQHHKCKSYRRTLPTALITSSESGVDEVGGKVSPRPGDHSLAKKSASSWQACSSNSSSRRQIGRRYWGGLANVFLAAVLLMLMGLCPRSGCDDTEQFQKNSEY